MHPAERVPDQRAGPGDASRRPHVPGPARPPRAPGPACSSAPPSGSEGAAWSPDALGLRVGGSGGSWLLGDLGSAAQPQSKWSFFEAPCWVWA